MRKVPQKKQKSNKFIFPFVIILILVTIFLASFIISYNLMTPETNNNDTQDKNITTEEYEQPEDMLSGSKNEDDRLADLRKENAELKRQVSQLEVENTQLRNELETLTATLENQSFVQQNASSTTHPSTIPSQTETQSGSNSTNVNPDITTSETGL